jgi:aspartyl-tRNA(Asn)/glutamyl-tRNA(Gln) amidotransferase subunit B
MNTRTEIKNLNSIRSLVRASRYEIDRQIKLVKSGGKVVQQTLGFNDETGETTVQRSKEFADDYRYFPEPDLPPLRISRELVAQIEKTLPELPDAKHERFISKLGLSPQDARVLVADKAVADYFEAVLKAGGDPKIIANWITGELFKLMNQAGVEIGQVKVTPEALVGLSKMVAAGTINTTTAKDVLGAMAETGSSAEAIVKERGLAQISDNAALEAAVDKILAANPETAQSYLGGKEASLGWLVGQVMKETRGQANASLVNQIMRTRLEALRSK